MLNRIWLIAVGDFVTGVRRPMIWVWIAVLALMYWGLSAGNVQIATGGDSTIGGTKQHLSSEFELTRIMSALTMIIHGFFASVLFGLTIIRDQDTGIMPILHSSKLKHGEYLVAKFLGCALQVMCVLAISSMLAMFFMYVVPSATRAEFFGPFAIGNFLYPNIKFVLPSLLMLCGVAFAIGAISRNSILVFSFPLLFLVIFGLFLNNWSPVWLPNSVNEFLCLVDPYGTRWLNENYFDVDRGAEFYNTQPVTLSGTFLASRFVIAGLGLLAFIATVPIFRKQLYGRRHGALTAVDQPNLRQTEKSQTTGAAQEGLGSLGMNHSRVGLLRDIWNITRYELKELRYSPSLYLFVPFIIIQVVGTSLFLEGAFGTPLLHTSGSLAQGAMTTLAILGCLLMMFYTVESQLRERIKGLAPIFYSTPARSFAMLMGKSLANTAVCIVIMAAALIACLIILLIQGVVSIEVFPFAAYWLMLLMPTFICWGSFITLAVVLTRNRYTTYGIGGAVLLGTLYLNLSGDMSWLTNWMMTDAAPWSDISKFEMDRSALWSNRLFILSLAVLFTYLAARVFWRRGFDAVQLATRLKPKSVIGFSLRALPVAILPLILGAALWSQINLGPEGDAAEDKEKKYWQQNFSTWANTKPPSVSGVDIRLDIQPEEQALSVEGIIRLTNDQEEPMSRFALSGGLHWKDVKWKKGETFQVSDATPPIPVGDTLVEYEAEDRSGLYVFKFDPPIQPGESTTLGYAFHGKYPDGISKNGGGAAQFILPSGVVLNTFGNAIFPVPGFAENVGLEDPPESKVFEKDFFEEKLKPIFGGGDSFHVRTTITGPADFTFNGVGVKVSDLVAEGQRTVVWESDSPVSFFNIVGGRWKVHKGETTEIYYSEKHTYNIDEISETIEQARAWYSRWFTPYPWRDLRLSEFPNMSTYAQGFATNITFSEGIGFLTKDKPGADAPFMVAAHETAHQWWGNILVPGDGPGGNILSEGMAHFSTGLLFDEVKGDRGRISFFELIEDQYGNNRSVDSERPLVEIDGSKQGDTTVTYDKGGWVFWMLLNHMGRTDNLQGVQSFIIKYSQTKDDHPVLQDFVNHLREFADDKEAFNEFTNQWFFDVVVPQYEFADVELKQDGDQWVVSGSVKNVGTGKMPLEICASMNERFIENDPNDDYLEARTEVLLDADESVPFEIRSSFKPEKVVVDPDAKVLQLKRKLAVHEF